eukprot:scaffold26656_cov149-Skeletonema_menzelii.AAC.5
MTFYCPPHSPQQLALRNSLYDLVIFGLFCVEQNTYLDTIKYRHLATISNENSHDPRCESAKCEVRKNTHIMTAFHKKY